MSIESTMDEVLSEAALTPMTGPGGILHVDSSSSEGRNRNQLLHQCLPISAMTLFDGYLLVVGEGPCLLLRNSKLNLEHPHEKFRRYQLFPNQLTITGIHFVEDSCGYPSRSSPWNGPDESHSVAFVWAGNHGTLITLRRPTLEIDIGDTYPYNSDRTLAFSYIPIAARWFDDGKTLVLLSVFNYVVVYERSSETNAGLKGLKEIAKYDCEQENLYSGAMTGEQLDDLIIFSGTTFQGVLVWDVKGGKANVRHKLMGHKGIPFSLEFESNWQMLLSASDDRNVIVWSFTDKDQDVMQQLQPVQIDSGYLQMGTNEGKKCLPGCSKIIQRITGHEARCWKAIWIKRAGFAFILSVGEDSHVRVQSFDKTYSKSWKAHDGASIYHCAYDQDDDILYTAAHDGSVFQWKRFHLKTQSSIVPFDVTPPDPRTEGMFNVNEYGRSLLNTDYPRSMNLWSVDHVVASMDSGRIIAFHLPSKRQFELHYDSNFKRYSVLSVSRRSAVTLLGGLNGDLIALRMSLEEINGIDETALCAELAWTFKTESKILNIIWLKDDKENRALIVCLDRAYLFHFYYEEDNKTEIHAELIKTFDLVLERPGIPCALLKGDLLVVGDEVGSITTLPVTSTQTESCIEVIKDVHQEGVTSIVEFRGAIMTAGRYGGVKSFKLQGDGPQARLVKIHEFVPPFEWVGKLVPIRNDEDLLLVGFQKGDLILYSWKDKRIISEVTDVGGGHRRWDLRFQEGDVTFSYIRDKEIYYSRISFDDCIDSILKPGLHSKTINCGIQLMFKQNNIFTATGSEDGTIRVFRYDTVLNSYFPIHRINNHASSVRTLASVTVDEHRVLLFSAGGRSEVLASHIGLDVEELTQCGKITLIKTKNRDTEIDTRIMDIQVIGSGKDLNTNNICCLCACSDGVVRALRYSFDQRKFVIISLLQGNGHGVMKLQIIGNHASTLVLGATSNGALLVWKWEPPTLDQKLEYIKNPEVIPFSFSRRVRNAAVMSFKVVPSVSMSPDAENTFEYMMAMGSDDCSVSLWNLWVPVDFNQLSRIKLNEVWSEDQNQRGPIIGVEIFYDGKDWSLFTCSNDQVISRWNSTNGTLLGKAFAGVSDCQGFIINSNQDCITCFGDGITWIRSP